MLVVPWVAYAVAIFYERPLDRRAVETSVFRRYVVFQFLWIYGSIVSLGVEDLTHVARQKPAGGGRVDCGAWRTRRAICKRARREDVPAWPGSSRGPGRSIKNGRQGTEDGRGNPFDDHDECDPARYGWILPNVVVVCCILLTFSSSRRSSRRSL